MVNTIIDKAKSEKKKVFIFAHKFPDGDAVCSSIALKNYLEANGVEAHYIVEESVTRFSPIVEPVEATHHVEDGNISVILDTTRLSYAENTLFNGSSIDDIYVIDHHEKKEGTKTIEDELGLDPSHVLRDPNSSSVCEILLREFDEKQVDKGTATALMNGLWTDTTGLTFLKDDTLDSFSKLLDMDADFEKVAERNKTKYPLASRVAIARLLIRTKKVPIGDYFGLILGVRADEVKNMYKKFGLRSPQKRIFMMRDVENAAFVSFFAENEPGLYAAEFRSSSSFGNFDVLSLATKFGGGGHLNASGCFLRDDDGYFYDNIIEMLEDEIGERYVPQAGSIKPIETNEADKELRRILAETSDFTQGMTREVVDRIKGTIRDGANFEYTRKGYISFETFMLRNEILSIVPDEVALKRDADVEISLAANQIEFLREKYKVPEESILDAISGFVGTDINSAIIRFPNGRCSKIDQNGNITYEYISQNPEVGEQEQVQE